MDFFKIIVKARNLALDGFIEKLDKREVNPRVLITAIGVFTDKLQASGHEEKAPEIRIIVNKKSQRIGNIRTE